MQSFTTTDAKTAPPVSRPELSAILADHPGVAPDVLIVALYHVALDLQTEVDDLTAQLTDQQPQ